MHLSRVNRSHTATVEAAASGVARKLIARRLASFTLIAGKPNVLASEIVGYSAASRRGRTQSGRG